MNEFDRFTEQGQEVAQLCAEILQRYGHNQIDTEHLLLALVEQSEITVLQILKTFNVDTKALITRIDATLKHSPKANIFGAGNEQIFITPRVKRVIDRANGIANEFKDSYISSEHFFIALISEDGTPAARILESLNVSSKQAYTILQKIRSKQREIPSSAISTTNIKYQQKDKSLNIFLCHSSGDKPRVRELYHQLLKEGLSPWLDEENLLPGYDWQIEIPKAVRNSDVVLVCLSKDSITKAGYIQKEIKQALDVADEQPEGTVFLIPVKLEECDVPERLSRWQWVNLFDNNGYHRLIRSLNIRAETKNNG